MGAGAVLSEATRQPTWSCAARPVMRVQPGRWICLFYGGKAEAPETGAQTGRPGVGTVVPSFRRLTVPGAVVRTAAGSGDANP